MRTGGTTEVLKGKVANLAAEIEAIEHAIWWAKDTPIDDGALRRTLRRLKHLHVVAQAELATWEGR